MKKRLVLLDAHSIIHRAYHALPDFSDSKGRPTGALFGLVSMLISIIKELNPDYIVAAYDMPQKTKRHEIFEDYKAGRKKADPALKEQLQSSKELLDKLSIPYVELAGYEADDILGTLAKKYKKDHEVIIASGDLDMLQLVDDKKVKVFTLKKGIKDTILYDESAVKARYGFGPDYMLDYKALRGDPSDNIPGVKGIGDKSATDLILSFGHLEDIYDTLEKNESTFEEKGFKPRVLKLLKEGKDEAFFSKVLASIDTNTPIDFSMPSKTWRESVNLQEALRALYDLDFRTLSTRFEALFEKNKQENELESEEIDTNSKEFKETAIALWLVRSDIVDPSLSDIYNFAGTKNFKEAKKVIFKVLHERKLDFVYEKIEKPLIPVIDKLNQTGIKLDVDYLKKLSKDYHKKLDKIKKEIFSLAGEEFNINSPLQLAKVLFEKMGIKAASSKKTASGLPSTQESELLKIKDKHPVIEKILQYRELQKLLSTYIDNLPQMVAKDDRLHTRFVQAGTTTGRLASQHPNLQNIPIRTELGKAVRHAFVAERGFKLYSFDYSQIELRIAAILSGDEKLKDAFSRGVDIHSAVASEVFEVSMEKVDSEMRRKAKVINFGILYGMGVNALKVNLGVESTKEARAFLDKYFEKYKTLATWIDKTKSDAARKGYTETLFGRRRYFEGIHSDLSYIRAAAERMAINAPIQGTQADIIKMAMHKIDKLISKFKDGARLVLQIHDELIYEIKNSLGNDLEPEIKNIMEGILSKKESKGVPIVVDVRSGKNWSEL